MKGDFKGTFERSNMVYLEKSLGSSLVRNSMGKKVIGLPKKENCRSCLIVTEKKKRKKERKKKEKKEREKGEEREREKPESRDSIKLKKI